MSGDRARVALRPATPADYDFLAALYASTRQEELAPVPWTDEQKAAFLAQQFAAQTAHYDQHYADATTDIVLVDGEPAGRLMLLRSENALHIVDIALLSPHRGRGIGTALLRPLIAEADERRVNLTIHVEQMNPALRLYERLGFERVGENGIYLKMERTPGTKSDKKSLST